MLVYPRMVAGKDTNMGCLPGNGFVWYTPAFFAGSKTLCRLWVSAAQWFIPAEMQGSIRSLKILLHYPIYPRRATGSVMPRILRIDMHTLRRASSDH